MTPALDERDRIRAAMDRILAGRPESSTGALTIVALAQEAGVPRNALTQRHLDLKNEFYAKVKARGELPDPERRLRKQLAKLKELRQGDQEDLRQLREDNAALIRVVNVLELENRRLRDEAAHAGSVVRSLPRRGPRQPT